jgi:hypothetical protein
MSRPLSLRTVDDEFPVATGSELQELAMRWNYVIRHRTRWSDNSQAQVKLQEDAAKDLGRVGLRASALRKLAQAGVVEVNVKYENEQKEWESRVFPWEYMLSAATRAYRYDQSLVVIRRLERRRRSAARARQPRIPQSLAIIEAAPPPFRESYDFEAENNLVRAALKMLKPTLIQDPTRKTLESKLRANSPDVIHLTGIDSRLGARLLKQDLQSVHDGIYLAHEKNKHEVVGAEDLASLLTAGSPNPQLVAFNCWESAGRLAPLAVAKGAGAAVGFQHTFDDSIGELFFVNFYRASVENQWDLLDSFLQAWHAIRSFRSRIQGSSIVLWSEASLVRKLGGRGGMTPTREALGEVRQRYKSRQSRIRTEARAADPKRDQIRDLVSVEVVPHEQLNYASLHNGRSLLKNLILRFMRPTAGDSAAAVSNGESSERPVGFVNDLEVTIQLNFGADSFPFRTKVSIGADDERFDLADPDPNAPRRDGNPPGGVRVALTSALARSVDECMQTSLFVEIRWHEQILYRHTHPVCLNPVDQWRLDDQEIKWLPSFIQPRDPAVARIIDAAQLHLKCLADYAPAGFDGYQSAGRDGKGVDLQVRAIWAAIAFGNMLHYINPPPSYAENTQRLRTPSQTVCQRRGTCVDLALLLASCLEWIEVYPVIFMLDDHAFPGYWRDLKAYDDFVVPEGREQVDEAADPADATEVAPWIFPRSAYAEIRKYVKAGKIVPLESVFLTSSSGFQEAVDEAVGYFKEARNRHFHSMVDVLRARENVTPLPLHFGEIAAD